MVPDARPVGRWEPAELGVHPVVGGGPHASMPAYIRRPHDELLRVVLDPEVADSRLIVVRGEACAGKSRAAYEAVADRLADWQLEYPPTVAALAARLEARIPAWTVLWLGELCRYADGDGGAAVLSRLAGLLDGEGHVVITTMWPEHWAAYVTAAGARLGAGDPAGRPDGWWPGWTSSPSTTQPGSSRLRRGHRRPGPVHRRGVDGRGRARRPGAGRRGGRRRAGRAGHPVPGRGPGAAAPLRRARRRPLRPGDHHRGDGRGPVRPRRPAARRARCRTPRSATWPGRARRGNRQPARRRLAWAAAELQGAVRALRPVPPRGRPPARRLPGRRLPRPAWPPHPPGPGGSGLAVGRPDRPRRPGPVP